MQEKVRTMEYSAASVKFLLWYIETKETAKLMKNHSIEEIRQMVVEEYLYQQKSSDRALNEFGCIKKRLEALPDELFQKIIEADIQTAKLITFIACMLTDRLLFEFMYEVYRNKIHFCENSIMIILQSYFIIISLKIRQNIFIFNKFFLIFFCFLEFMF